MISNRGPQTKSIMSSNGFVHSVMPYVRSQCRNTSRITSIPLSAVRCAKMKSTKELSRSCQSQATPTIVAPRASYLGKSTTSTYHVRPMPERCKTRLFSSFIYTICVRTNSSGTFFPKSPKSKVATKPSFAGACCYMITTSRAGH